MRSEKDMSPMEKFHHAVCHDAFHAKGEEVVRRTVTGSGIELVVRARLLPDPPKAETCSFCGSEREVQA